MAEARVPITIVFVNSQDGSWAEPLVDALRRHGYHVLLAATVRAAEVLVALLGRASLDLIITTVQPRLQDQYERGVSHVPCILISDAPPPDRLALPVVWWLATPLTPDILLAAVRDTLHSEGKGCTQ
jgi:hypothetical protein